MTTIQGYPALVVILILMLCVYILGRTRGYRKAAKRYKAPSSTSRALLTSEDLGVIGEIVTNALNQALGYDPDCDDGGLVQLLHGIEAAGSHWTDSVHDGLQLVKSEIIEHVSQEIRAQDKRTIKRDSMRATRTTKNAETTEAAS